MTSSTPLLAVTLLLLLFSSGLAWSEPTVLLDRHNEAITIHSVYRDPGSSSTHVVVGLPGQILHFAILESGGYYKTMFATASPITAVLRGAGDGAKLFLAYMTVESERNVVRFSESANGGKDWSSPVVVAVSTTFQKYLNDMVYIKETGRVIVFFSMDAELRMASRPSGSIVFSAEGLVARNMYAYIGSAVAGYSLFFSRPYIHVAYKANAAGNYRLMYARSTDNGATWGAPISIGDAWAVVYLTKLIANSKMDSSVFISYTGARVGSLGTARMTYSTNYGSIFQPHVNITANSPNLNSAGLASCSDSKGDIKLLVSFFPRIDDTPQLVMWDQSSIMSDSMSHPFNMIQVMNTGTDCSIDVEKSMMRVFTFATVWDGDNSKLYYATEETPVPVGMRRANA